MDETQFLLRVIAGLAVVGAVAVAALAVAAVRLMRISRRLEERASEFFESWEPVAPQASTAISDFSEQSGELISRLNALSALLHKQALRIDSTIHTLAATAERNVEEVDAAGKAILSSLNKIAKALEGGVRVPLVQVRALSAGLAAAARQLSRGQPANPDQLSTDEEMFI